MKVAVVGATGLVGSVMMKVLEERNFPVDTFIPVASEKSIGKVVNFNGKPYSVVGLSQSIALRPDIALFSAGGTTSLEWAPKFAAAGIKVIDNSSAWRKDPLIPLVVPEVNADVITKDNYIIANPNCSTIQLVMVLDVLHHHFGLKRIIVSTYQSVTGSGVKGVRQLSHEREGKKAEMIYPHPIDLNVIPQGGFFEPNGYTSEENKLVFESRKILRLPKLRLSGTVVRVPVFGGHSESVNVELERSFNIENVKDLFCMADGIVLQDNPVNFNYPMPIYAEGRDEVFVGRIRRDETAKNALNLWVVSDNLRKGAATNAVQIAQYMVENGLL